MLEIKNVTISYGDRPTVKNFSMTLKKGEIASIAGESGSGKTTVIRAVLGLLPGGGKITGGDILFEGKSLLDNLCGIYPHSRKDQQESCLGKRTGNA